MQRENPKKAVKLSLLMYFMPFEMKKWEFLIFGYEVSDITCRAILKQKMVRRVNKVLV
jgi:hypothetical protein